MLDREEYVEQAYFFRVLLERITENMTMQELLVAIRDEVLATTNLPMAIDFMLSELRHTGAFATAMAKLPHYFTPYQAYVMGEAENERGRFDIRIALKILEREAEYRSKDCTLPGVFLYQFETLCRNRLRYDRGLTAVANDPLFAGEWKEWILSVRRRVGMLDFPDLVYICSEHYLTQQLQRTGRKVEVDSPILFGEKEGRIALANRKKDPLLFFAAIQRHLGYPAVPLPEPPNQDKYLLPRIMRRLEQFDKRIKLLEEEQRESGIDLSQFLKNGE